MPQSKSPAPAVVDQSTTSNQRSHGGQQRDRLPPDPPQYLQAREFFSRLGVSRSTGWRMISSGRLKPPIQLTDRIRVYEASYLRELVEGSG